MYGKPVAGSNIIDLVNDVLRQRKDTEPRGWEHFAEVLRDMNVPQDFVGSKKRWEWMYRTPPLPREEEEEYGNGCIVLLLFLAKKKKSMSLPKPNIDACPLLEKELVPLPNLSENVSRKIYLKSVCHEKIYQRRIVCTKFYKTYKRRVV